MDRDQGGEAPEQHSQNAVRQRCLSALAALSIQPSVVQESTPVLLEVLSSAHAGNLSGWSRELSKFDLSFTPPPPLFFRLFVSGSVHFSVEEVVLTCRSLQRIAGQARDTEETGRCFHDIIIPRLLSLALQAALQGERFLLPFSAKLTLRSTGCPHL